MPFTSDNLVRPRAHPSENSNCGEKFELATTEKIDTKKNKIQ
jgi:hypothetical protein